MNMPLKFTFIALMVVLFRQAIAGRSGLQHGSHGLYAGTDGVRFVANGKPLYLNGFNAYWLMYMAFDPSTRDKVTSAFQQASMTGMNIARTWAFSDGGYRTLQVSPGSYNEDMFKGLDYVISEAKRHGIYLILSLVNNWNDFGGRKQYVEWAKDRGQHLNNDDEFFTNPITKRFYKDHVKAVVTRRNSITGVAYKDDPTIFAWELMNEPRCNSDLSGKSLQAWVSEMAAYVKSIDNNHMVEIGLEGFYGPSTPDKKQVNPGGWIFGTDFISNNQIPHIDFTTIHMYPEQWVPNGSESDQAAFVDKWVEAHIADSTSILKKPILIAEFGKSSKTQGYSIEKRDAYFEKIYNAIYKSASNKGACAGGAFWQLLAKGMENFWDGYEVLLEESPSTSKVIAQQSRKLSSLT